MTVGWPALATLFSHSCDKCTIASVANYCIGVAVLKLMREHLNFRYGLSRVSRQMFVETPLRSTLG